VLTRTLDIHTREFLTIQPLAIHILGADLRGIKCDDLTEHDLLVLKQNGAIVEGIKPSC